MARNFYAQPGIGLQFKTYGRWDETIKTIQRLGPTIKQASVAAQMLVCREIARRVKAHLRNQDLNWRPLSPEYRAAKAAYGWDRRILLATHTYYDNIEVFKKGNQHLVYVGVRKGIYGRTPSGKRNRLELAKIAVIHEFSSNSKRRRPLWNPTIREMGGVTGLKELYTKHLHKELRKRRIPISAIGKIRWH